MSGSEASREDKQLPATDRRLQQAAEEGNVARSRDAGHVIVLGAGLGTLVICGAAIRTDLTRLLRSALDFDQVVRSDVGTVASRILPGIAEALLMSAVVLGIGALGAIAASAIPGGIHVSGKALDFKTERLNPMSGLQRIFSLRNLVEFLKLGVLAVVLGAVAAWFTVSSMPEFASLSLGAFDSAIVSSTLLVVGGFALLLLVLVAVALFDVPFQWFRHRADLRMTRDEVRREMRETDGDPHQKAHRRARQREISQRRMMSAVPTADIVIVNPTHYAVAIRYEEGRMGAPRVVAKGVDVLAARIQAIAREAGVPVLRAAPLARALYAHVDLDDEVPQALYAAIAQVLAYVYQLRNWVPGRGKAPMEPVDLPVPAALDPHQAADSAARGGPDDPAGPGTGAQRPGPDDGVRA